MRTVAAYQLDCINTNNQAFTQQFRYTLLLCGTHITASIDAENKVNLGKNVKVNIVGVR